MTFYIYEQDGRALGFIDGRLSHDIRGRATWNITFDPARVGAELAASYTLGR